MSCSSSWTTPQTRWRAAVSAVTSRVGHVGVVPFRTGLGTPPTLRDGLHLLDAGTWRSTPHGAALLVLDQVLTAHHRPPPDDARLLVF